MEEAIQTFLKTASRVEIERLIELVKLEEGYDDFLTLLHIFLDHVDEF